MLAALKSALGMKSWPEFTREEVAQHNTKDSLWLVADDKVYDATSFLDVHPGGHVAILKRGGGCADCQQDYKFHSKGARDQWKGLQIGVLSSASRKASIPCNAAPDPEMIRRETPLLRFGNSFTKPPPDVEDVALPSVASVSFVTQSFASPSTSTEPAVTGANNEEGGEDVMACGRCCRNSSMSAQCVNCPNAPRCCVRDRAVVREPDPEGTVPLRR